ncbi:hypothetical protein C0989_008210 [Termitomyces sp. Mn162]|nr:hypothetical protein C0989_008210 [Termitomyces sp. Mn162]
MAHYTPAEREYELSNTFPYVKTLPRQIQIAHPLAVPSSAAWRIPLGIQLVPGAILGFGCFFLPPSPRLLVLHGRYDDAMATLAQLRLRSSEEARHDPLLQIELLEMKVETALVQRVLNDGVNERDNLLRPWSLESELHAWKRLFQKKYRDRTWIGVLVMVFQRKVIRSDSPEPTFKSLA